MKSVLLLVYFMYFVYTAKASVCENNVTFVQDDDFLGINISTAIIKVKFDITKKVECSVKCHLFSNCVSFFYNSNTKTCQFNSKIFVSTLGSQNSLGSVYYRKKTECSVPPTFTNANLVSALTPPFQIGIPLLFHCNSNFFAENKINTITCQVDGTWSSIACQKIRSCSDVKQCNGLYDDGHYWIYPLVFGVIRVKIYCHDMAGTPSDFVSLPVINIGFFPNLNNKNCDQEQTGPCSSTIYPGQTDYRKIRVNIETMEVVRDDQTFAVTVFGSTRKYGEAKDCYSIHYGNKRASCGPKGTFNIDVTGTGLKIDPQLTWEIYGWNYWGEVVKNVDNTKIDLLCGAWSGGCKPTAPMFLKLFSDEEPAEITATTPSCLYPQ